MTNLKETYRGGKVIDSNGRQLDTVKRGGNLKGRLHKECNDDGYCGIKLSNNGEPLEAQGGEVIITEPAVKSKELHKFDGKEMTNKEILSAINVSGGGVEFEKGGELKNLEIGNRINHSRFGNGTVLNTDNGIVEIKFDNGETKRLIERYAPLTKIGGDNDIITPIQKNDVIKPDENIAELKTERSTKEYSQRKPLDDIDVEGFTILKSTDKSYLIKRGNETGWIPKGWVASEGENNTIRSFKHNFYKRAIENLKPEKVSEFIDSPNSKIEKETEKAYLIDVNLKMPDGTEKVIQVWFPKSKVKEENGIIEFDEDFLRIKESEIQGKNGYYHAPNPPYKGEKSIGYNLSVYENMSEQTVGRSIYFPLSQVKEVENGYLIPAWLYDAKIEEIYDSVKIGAWQYSSNNVFEIEGLDMFQKVPIEIKFNKGGKLTNFDKKIIEDQINVLNLTFKYLDLKEQKIEIDTILDQINSLEIVLKYL